MGDEGSDLRVGRVRDEHTGDAARVLVDRLWPRGVSKDAAHLDLWAKDLAPSTELRKWYAHDPERWQGFQERYRAELDAAPPEVMQAADEVLALLDDGPVVLLTATKDPARSQAPVLRDWLETRRRDR